MDLLSLDKKIFFLINQGLANPLLDGLMPFLSARGYLLLLPFLMYLLYTASKEQHKGNGFDISAVLQIAAVSICAVFLSDWLGNELKNTFMRVRPCNSLEDVRLLVGCTQSGSFPSNHAANSFAYALPLFYLTRNHLGFPARLYPFALACLVALSRVYVGVHYPTDIMAGALFGTMVSLLLIMLYKFAGQSYQKNQETTLLLAGLATISVFRIYYILHGPLDLSPDEAHYWEWSRRLDLSYYSKGPMIAYLIHIGTFFFGDTVLGIRIMAAIFSVLSSVFMFKLAILMYGNTSGKPVSRMPECSFPQRSGALLSALAFQAIPLFAAYGILFTIDSPFIFFWTISLYIFYKALSEQPKKQWIYWTLLGISIGFGLLTKYTMAFFYLCGLLLLVFSDKRSLLRTPMPYIAFIISMIIFTPVIIWNARYGWVTVLHTAGQAHVADGITLSTESFLNFLGSQIGTVTPLFFCLMIFALFKLFLSDRGLQSKFLFFFSIPVIAFFLLKACQGKVQANWAMFGYITGIIAAVQFSLSDHSRIRRALLTISICFSLVLTAISHYPSIVGLPQKLDPSARLRGWKALGSEVSILSEQMAKQGNLVLFSDSYQIASELAFYVKGHPETFSINLGRRMDQYDLWPDINSRALELRKKRSPAAINGIFVKSGLADMPPTVAQAFDHFDKKIFSVYEHGSILREYSIFICYNFTNLKIEKPETF
ncbi:MAG: glycosyltransferase family 39 protein [Dissulfurispiraceae bacterium]|jgi:undecaprenyl-diphosphatase